MHAGALVGALQFCFVSVSLACRLRDVLACSTHCLLMLSAACCQPSRDRRTDRRRDAYVGGVATPDVSDTVISSAWSAAGAMTEHCCRRSYHSVIYSQPSVG